ncbi:hypothetical protein HK102_007112, partial [Quaeritorhiza haematococci]
MRKRREREKQLRMEVAPFAMGAVKTDSISVLAILDFQRGREAALDGGGFPGGFRSFQDVDTITRVPVSIPVCVNAEKEEKAEQLGWAEEGTGGGGIIQEKTLKEMKVAISWVDHMERSRILWVGGDGFAVSFTIVQRPRGLGSMRNRAKKEEQLEEQLGWAEEGTNGGGILNEKSLKEMEVAIWWVDHMEQSQILWVGGDAVAVGVSGNVLE